MKITAIGIIKNAADVIEACIRGNSWLIDQFVFLDNMSTDRTVEILQALQAEGFQIEIINDNEIQHAQAKKMDDLCAYACEKYPCDFFIPLDDDEILVLEDANSSISNMDVRCMLSTLDQNAIYYVPWRIYIPTEYDNSNQINVAKRQTFCFSDDNIHTYHKVIIPSNMIKEDGFHLKEGNHGVNFSKKHHAFVLAELRFAHFPIRSEEQIKSKALIGWTNMLTIPDRDKKTGFHWGIIYEKIRDGNPITIELLQSLCTLYLHPDADVQIVKKPVTLPKEYMQIKYTHLQEVNALKNYCLNVETLATKYATLLTQTTETK